MYIGNKMVPPVVIAFAALLLVGGGWAVQSWRAPDDAAALATGKIRAHPLPLELAEPPAVATVEDGDDGVAPIVTVLLDDAGDPAQHLVWSTVDSVLDAVHPVFASRPVERYEFQLAYATDDTDRIRYRRVAVPGDLAERHLDDRDWRSLRDAVENRDDAVFWNALEAGTGPSVADRQDAPIVAAVASCDTGPLADRPATTAASTGDTAETAAGDAS